MFWISMAAVWSRPAGMMARMKTSSALRSAFASRSWSSVRRGETAMRAGVRRAGLTGPLKSPDGSGKFEWLSSHSLVTTAWEEVVPVAPDFAFARRRGGNGEWRNWPSLPDLFNVYSQGLKTHRDHFAVAF